MKKTLFAFLTLSVMFIFIFKDYHSVQAADVLPPDLRSFATTTSDQQTDDNLLINGDMDQKGFYWRPPNHYVAGMWFEWWSDHIHIPEYIDGGSQYHNVCYPSPGPGQLCKNNHSQGYIRWGNPFKAGMYQVVNGTEPCTLYEFSIYNRNDTASYHPRVGIEPTGWYNTQSGGNSPDNCPPDGKSKCPNPHLNINTKFPATMVWSAEFDHTAYTWEKGSITAEAVGSTVSVWTYAAPDSGTIHSTYWDAGTLIQVPFPNGRLPEPESTTPSGFIQNLTVATLDKVIISWDTPEAASTQVWYTVVAAGEGTPSEYTEVTPLDTSLQTQHQVIIEEGLNVGDTVHFVALSRRPNTDRCTTETSGPQSVTIPEYITPDDWTPSSNIQNLTTESVLDTLFITWDTPYTATTQVWYTIIHAPEPTTPTTSIMISYPIYLPMISRLQIIPTYSFKTVWDLNMVENHKATIRGLKNGDAVYFVAISSRLVDNRVIVTEVSEEQYVGQIEIPDLTSIYLPIIHRMQ
ncbi:MAG: hypothetical protein JXA33_27320 [Anaerolineae bacterium]|nr:hypothetical protein [Anaerolineae bacterium]